ncbi:hypothetical protein ACN2C6_12935 [Caulobacter sp. ErkDOM-YI]
MIPTLETSALKTVAVRTLIASGLAVCSCATKNYVKTQVGVA